MKTKLTLNVDDKIVARAKRFSSKRNTSLSAVVEEYLDRVSANSELKTQKKGETITDRIRKLTHPVNLSDEEIKKMKDEYLESKYGK